MTNPDREELVKLEAERAELVKLEAERAELAAENEAATSWGAAVGARCERILEIDRRIAALTAPGATTKSDSGVKGEPEPVAWPANLHPRTLDLVQRFALALAKKLRLAEEKYGHTDGWSRDDWEAECRDHLYQHLEKGDPRDVAAYCAFMWHHGWITYRPEITASPADAGMREAFVRVLASLAAAISILERTPKAKKAVASDKMFDTMLDDYRKALEAGRRTLTAPGATTKSDGGNEQYLHEVADGSWGDPPLIRAAARDRLAAIAAKKSDGSVKCSGFGECAAVNADGVLCPDDTCDYDTGVRKPGPSDPSSTRSEVAVEGIASVMGCLRVMWSGSDWVIAEDSVSEAARALLDQFEIRRK